MRTTPNAVRILVAALALLVANGCGSSDGGDTGDGSPATSESSELVVTLDDTVNLIEPHTFRSRAAYTVTRALYEPLISPVMEEQEDGLGVASDTEFVGAGAESYEIAETDDGLRATFELHRDAEFADGTPVTARDYKYTFDRSLLGPGYIGSLLPFIGIESRNQIRAVDDYTLEIETNVQSPLFERFLTFQVFGAMNKKLLEQNDTEDDTWSFDYLADKAAGSGPYELETYRPESEVVLAPNPGYWDADNVANGRVTIRNVPDANQRALLVESGEIDLAAGLPPDLMARLENSEAVNVYSTSTTGVTYLGMNQDIAPLDDVDVRRAILHAVPYQALVDQVMRGFASPAQGVVTSTMETHDAEVGSQYTTDLDQASQLLADSGAGDVSLELGVRESRPTDQEAAVLIQDNLRQMGINVEVLVLPDADFGERIANGELPLFIHDWFSWGEDPFYQMQLLTTCEQATNYARFCDEEYDRLVREGTFSTDDEVRGSTSSDAQRIFFEAAPWAPLWAADRTLVAGRCVTGITIDYTMVPGFEDMSKTESC